MPHFQSFINKKILLRKINSISKKSYFTEFQYGSFFDIKTNPGGLLWVCLFLRWIYILTNKRNLQNEHFGRNYSNFGLKMILYSASWGSFRTNFYHNIITYAIITGFRTKLAVILCIFSFWLSTSDFWRNSSSKSAPRSQFRKLNYLRVKLAH